RLAALGLAALAVLLGSAPFLHLPGVFRTQFLSGPGQAALLALALGLLASLVPARLGRGLLAGGVGLLAANAAVLTLRAQAAAHAEAPVSFAKTAHVFRQVRALAPRFAPDTLLL